LDLHGIVLDPDAIQRENYFRVPARPRQSLFDNRRPRPIGTAVNTEDKVDIAVGEILAFKVFCLVE
jgi:hypothetical protein